MNSLADADDKVLTCTGPSGDHGPGEWSVKVATKRAAAIEKGAAPGNPDYRRSEEELPEVLPSMHKIFYDGITCATSADRTTACRVGDHGFVLTRTTTHVF